MAPLVVEVGLIRLSSDQHLRKSERGRAGDRLSIPRSDQPVPLRPISSTSDRRPPTVEQIVEQQTQTQRVSIRDIAPRYKIIWAEFLEANGNERLTIDQHTAVFIARRDYVHFFENIPGLKHTDTSPSVREIRILLRVEKAAGIQSQAEQAEQEERERAEREHATPPSALAAFLANLNPPPLPPPLAPKTPKTPRAPSPGSRDARVRGSRDIPPSLAKLREKARRLRQYLEEDVEDGISAGGSYPVMTPEGMTLRQLEEALEPPARRSTRWYFPTPAVWAYNPYPKNCRLGMQRRHPSEL
jgi:hypothetical protein